MFHDRTRLKMNVIAAAAAMACYGASAATIVNVDIGAANQGASQNNLPGVLGDQVSAQWNSVTTTGALFNNLADEDGNSTTVSFQIDNQPGSSISSGGGLNDFFRGYVFLGNTTSTGQNPPPLL